MVDDTQLDAFKQAALSQGFSPEEVDGFVKMAIAGQGVRAQREADSQASDLADYEKRLQIQQKYGSNGANTPGSLTEAETAAINQGIAELQPDEAGGFRVVSKKGTTDPLQWAADNQAFNYLTGKDMGARNAQATAMQKLGLDGYLKASALPDLLTEKELKAREEATGFLNTASSLVSQLQNGEGTKNIQGVGPIGRFRPDFLTNQEGTSVLQNITDLSAQKMKAISGVAISEQEFKRLSQMLPKDGDTEKKIKEKSQNIANSIEIGLQMQEYAKRERLTLDEAYKKYGANAFKEKGMAVPSWIGGSSKPGLDIGKDNSQRDTAIKNLKAGGFSDEQINEYLKVKGL